MQKIDQITIHMTFEALKGYQTYSSFFSHKKKSIYLILEVRTAIPIISHPKLLKF